jgi:hypothetical protein
MTVRPLQSAWRFSRNELSGKPGAVQSSEATLCVCLVTIWGESTAGPDQGERANLTLSKGPLLLRFLNLHQPHVANLDLVQGQSQAPTPGSHRWWFQARVFSVCHAASCTAFQGVAPMAAPDRDSWMKPEV